MECGGSLLLRLEWKKFIAVRFMGCNVGMIGEGS